MRPASAYGSGLSRTVWITLKMVVAAAMPIASVSGASSVKPGDVRSLRALYRRSCTTSVNIALAPRLYLVSGFSRT
jgi:hypothetical protein